MIFIYKAMFVYIFFILIVELNSSILVYCIKYCMRIRAAKTKYAVTF